MEQAVSKNQCPRAGEAVRGPSGAAFTFRAAGGMRRGNMGHLTRIANAVVRNLERGPAHTPVGEVIRGEDMRLPSHRESPRRVPGRVSVPRGRHLFGLQAVHGSGWLTGDRSVCCSRPLGPRRTPRFCPQSGCSLNSGGFGDLPSTSLGAEEVASVPWTRPLSRPLTSWTVCSSWAPNFMD